MRSSTNGHRGLENDVRREETVGDFKIALSYLKESQSTAYFVVHAHSSKWHSGTGLQRSSAAPTREKTFLDRLGFQHSNSCNVLQNGECHYKIIAQVDRTQMNMGHSANKQFDLFVENFQEIYDLMHDLDKKLQRSGFELPYDNLELNSLEKSDSEAVYEGNQVYDFYKDFKDKLLDAQNEVFLIDSYVNEEVLELYVENLNPKVDIRILTKNPKGNFQQVAQKLAKQRGGGFEVRKNPSTHDRLVFIDNSCYVLGQSVKDAAKKPTYMVQIQNLNNFRNNFETLWQNGTPLI